MINYPEKRLEQQGIKPTAMRLLVLEYLLEQKAGVSLKEVEEAFERADRITLYRTLKTFEEKGLIHSIDDGGGSTKYALCEEGCQCAPEDLHVHFHCYNCQKTFCLPKIGIPSFQLPAKFNLQEINLTAKGVCADCQ